MKQSVCLLTAYDSVQQPLAAFTVPSMQAFAQAHGYEMRAVYKEDWERLRGWIKIEAILAALENNFDFIFWVDVDSIILRRDVDVRAVAVDDACLHMAWHGPDTSKIVHENFVPHFNTGVMLIRVTEWSRNFFGRVWEVGQLPHPWFDQATILHLLGFDDCLGLGPSRPDEPNRSRLARLPAAWNSVPGIATAPNAIIHHYAGLYDPSTRLRLVEMDARTAPLREGASTELRQAFAEQLCLWREDVATRDSIIADRNSALAELLAERHALVAERDGALAQLQAVRNSTWRHMALLRRINKILQRLGTRDRLRRAKAE